LRPSDVSHAKGCARKIIKLIIALLSSRKSVTVIALGGRLSPMNPFETTAEMSRMIGAEAFRRMKSTAILINTARGAGVLWTGTESRFRPQDANYCRRPIPASLWSDLKSEGLISRDAPTPK